MHAGWRQRGDHRAGGKIVGYICCLHHLWLIKNYCSVTKAGRGKLRFPLLKSVKCQKGDLGQTVSTNFVADCSYILVEVV